MRNGLGSRWLLVGGAVALSLAGGVGCGASGSKGMGAKSPVASTTSATSDGAGGAGGAGTAGTDAVAPDDGYPASRAANPNGAWIGASAESEVLLAGSEETTLGIWVDAPRAKTRVHSPVDLALVIDTSGSMAGAKLDNARAAAKMLIESLPDGDIVSIDTFNDEAKPLIAPTTLSKESRSQMLSRIAELRVGGSTNMFDGLALGEAHVARAPTTHTVRRVVVISDGIANVGPSSPEALGQLAERGVRFHAQVTSIGVGTEYDELTLNALAVRSAGRLYHLTDPKEMTSMLKREIDLLESTVASDAFVEVVPAPGVQVIAADGIRSEWGQNGALRIPLGALFGGQHREALVRIKVREGGAVQEGTQSKPLASVRLHFRDPGEGDLERIQETVARVAWTNDPSVVSAHANAKTRSIMAVQDAAKLQMQAAQQVNQGQFDGADLQLAHAEKKLSEQAHATKDDSERQRLTVAAQNVASSRAATKAASAAPPAARRPAALKLNADGMSGMGF